MIVHDVAAAIPAMRRNAESLMVTPCVVTRPGEPGTDPETGADVPTGDTVPATRCKIQGSDNQVRDAESGLGTVATQKLLLHFPASAGPFKAGDVVEADGRKFRIENVPNKTWQTAQRLPVEELAF